MRYKTAKIDMFIITL